MTKTIADRMAEAAEMDLALPYSLVLDALDRLRLGGMEPLIRTLFERDLTDALDAYDADQLGYWTEERIRRAGPATDYNPADDGAVETCEDCRTVACDEHAVR